MPRLRSRAALTAPSATPTASSTRPRRGNNPPQPAAVIERSSPEETRQSIHLTVKASPSALRKATSGTVSKTTVNSRNIVSGKRASRSSRVIREVDSDDEDEEEDEPEPMDVDEDEDEEDDDDAEGEDDDEADADGDEDDEVEVTPAPRIVLSNNDIIRAKARGTTNVAQDSVEAKEMILDDDDDEELSELESDLEEEEEEEDEDEEDAEGEEDEDAEGEEDDELPAQNDDEDEDEEMESDDETPGSMSRSHTPDLSKLTRRQRAMVIEENEGHLMALSNEAQKKKHLTEEEHAMRRAEMARRRKNLSEKRNEEEKMDTINRLLKKQPSKRQKRLQDITDDMQDDEPEVERASPLYVRYTQTANGTSLALPDEWLQGPAGQFFAGTTAKPAFKGYSGRMVEEVA